MSEIEKIVTLGMSLIRGRFEDLISDAFIRTSIH